MLPLFLQLSALRIRRILRQFPWGVWTYINKETEDCGAPCKVCASRICRECGTWEEGADKCPLHPNSLWPSRFTDEGLRSVTLSMWWSMELRGGAWLLHQRQVTMCMRAKLLQSCPTLRGPMNCTPPGECSVHRINQTRILEWVAISFSRGFSNPGIQPKSPAAPALQADSLLLSHWGSPVR